LGKKSKIAKFIAILINMTSKFIKGNLIKKQIN